MERKEIVIVGAGPAGMAAAVKLCDMGFRDLVIIEKESRPGGVLNQCIHPGFGLVRFGKNLTGPEYKALYEDALKESGAELLTETTVMSVEKGSGYIRVLAQTPDGEAEFGADAVILASGCRETGRGALGIAGSRPAGIYTAGTAQGMMNLRNTKVGSRIVIIGSGDIGLIMARRFTLEGSRVVCIVEKESVCGGLERNLKECVEDFGIPLLTESVVCRINGRKRVESVAVRNRSGEETEYLCDTVILSAGLVPEDGMADKSIEGLFFCGNALYVHDLVDDVSQCGEDAAMDTAGYLLAKMRGKSFESAYAASNVETARKERRAFLEQRKKSRMESRFNNTEYIICTMCPNGCRINAVDFTGGKCSRGEAYARSEAENPKRILTGSVRIKGTGDIVSVRTDRPVPLNLFREGMRIIGSIDVEAPVGLNQVLAEDFLEKGTRLITTSKYE
ncbi:MAG: FAD-dependent oxidoreductase [Bacillota bacterium]|nr:FAD-dependent oxidoreductase [Bacillota bacterium]